MEQKGQTGEIVMYQPDETIRLEVKLKMSLYGLIVNKWQFCLEGMLKQLVSI